MDSPKKEALKEEIICPLCFCVYDNPLSLECMHSYCEECLYNLHRSKNFADAVDCPECRSPTAMGDEGIHGLKRNFKLKRIVEILSVEEKREIARKNVHRYKPLPPVPPASVPPPEPLLPHCSQHSDRQLEYYCTQCKALICSQCMLESHRFHREPIPAKKALDRRIDALKMATPQADGVLSMAGSVLEKMQSDVDGIWRNVDRDVELAQQYFQKLQTLLKERELEICKRIEARATKHQERIEKQRKLVQNSIDEIENTKATIHDLVENRATDVQVLVEERQITDKLDLQAQHLDLLLNKSKEKSRVSYHSPFHPDPQFEALCKVVGIRSESNTPLMDARHTFAMTPNPPRAKSKLAERASSNDGFTTSPEKSVHLKETERERSNTSPLPELMNSLEMREVDGATIYTPSTIVNSSSLLGPTHQKPTSASPSGVCIGNSSTLVVADTKNHMFSVLTPTGKFLHSYEVEGKSDGQLVEPSAVVCHGGKIYIVDKGQPPRVQLFTDSGKFISKFKVRGNLLLSAYLGEPIGMLPVDEKTFLVSDSEKSCVHVFDDEGRYQGKFGDTELKTKQPAGMTLDSRGNVFIADRGNHCVWIYTCGGQYVSKIGKHGSAPGELNYPFGVTIDKLGNIHVSESGNHRISVFAPGGKFVRCFGKKGTEPGMFMYPRHLCVDSHGRLVVADEQNQRLQIFNILDM